MFSPVLKPVLVSVLWDKSLAGLGSPLPQRGHGSLVGRAGLEGAELSLPGGFWAAVPGGCVPLGQDATASLEGGGPGASGSAPVRGPQGPYLRGSWPQRGVWTLSSQASCPGVLPAAVLPAEPGRAGHPLGQRCLSQRCQDPHLVAAASKGTQRTVLWGVRGKG